MTPEPEPGERHRPELAAALTQTGHCTRYTVIVDDISEVQQSNLAMPVPQLVEQDGRWVVQESSGQQGPESPVLSQGDLEAQEVQETLKELETLQALEDYGALDVAFPRTSEGHLARVRHQVIQSSPSLSPSSDREDVSNIAITPPRHEPFVSQRNNGHYTGLNQSAQNVDVDNILRDVRDDGIGQEEIVAEILVQNADRLMDETQEKDNEEENVEKAVKKRKNKKREELDRKRAEVERKQVLYEEAVKAFKENKYESYRSCAKAYGVSDVTLRKIILRNKPFQPPGKRSTILREDEEAKLINHLKYCAKVGFGLSLYDVQLLVQELLSAVVR